MTKGRFYENIRNRGFPTICQNWAVAVSSECFTSYRCGDSRIVESAVSVTEAARFHRDIHGVQMTGEIQRKILVRIGCEKAVNAIDQNGGRPLSPEQLQTYFDASIDEGLTGRAIAIASLRGSPLTPDQLSKLIDRCIQYESFSDAIHASQQGPIPDATRERLLEALVENNLAANRQEAEDLLTSD